jgi:M3 family oligoendopeptidase
MKFDEMKYERPDMTEALAELRRNRQALEQAGSYDQAREAFLKEEKDEGHLETMYTLAQIRHDINTADAFYKQENEFWMEQLPLMETETQAFRRSMMHGSFRDEFAGEYGEIMFLNAAIAEKAFDEKIVPDIQKENRLAQAYEDLLASAQVAFEGKKYTLSQMEPFQNDPDDTRREQAWIAVGSWYKSVQPQMDRIYDELVHLRDQMGRKMGYESYTPLGYYRMERNCWNREDIERFRQAVVKYVVPAAEQVYQAQAARTGCAYPLSFADADLAFRSGNPKPQGTDEDVLQAGLKFYTELSPETGEFFTMMMNDELMNTASTEGKAGGGYCTGLPDYHVPYIFANFNGTQGDVEVITHEAGHAFAAWMNRNRIPRSTIWPTSEACECHSMSMEFFGEQWAEDFFGKDADKYRYEHLADALKFIPYGTAVDHFQHEIYDHPDYTPAERHVVWKKLMGIYMPWYRLDGKIPFFSDGEHWQLKHHIYSSPFYYIDYCLAQTVSLEFWAMIQDDPAAAWQKYMAYTKLGGSDTWVNMLKQANLDSPLESVTLRNVAEKAGKWLAGHDLKEA